MDRILSIIFMVAGAAVAHYILWAIGDVASSTGRGIYAIVVLAGIFGSVLVEVILDQLNLENKAVRLACMFGFGFLLWTVLVILDRALSV